MQGAPGYRGRMERYYGFREVLEKLPQISFRQMTFEKEMRFTEHLKAIEAGYRVLFTTAAHLIAALTKAHARKPAFWARVRERS